MTAACRSWWRNCAFEADPEMLAIDGMEDRLAPLAPNVTRVRELISTLELCHHKAGRWVENILQAIGAGETTKGLGTRLPGPPHPAERVWQTACAALAAWCAGCPAAKVEGTLDTVPASRLLSGLGDRSPLKEWQVQRVREKIGSAIHWPQSSDDPSARYEWLLLDASGVEPGYHRRCPGHYREHEDFWGSTVRTLLHDRLDGEEATVSLGLAIDMLMPCHWRFVENLRVVLEAIGGKLHPETPFAACGRNISLVPVRRRMEIVGRTLRVFLGEPEPGEEWDREVLASLGAATEVKRWLAISLDKTIRLQLNPPPEVRALSALAGPDWIAEDGIG